MKDDITLRQTFDQVALLYNEVRPRYPDTLFSTLIEVTGLSPNAKLLEIGPGTGQATKPLAIQGYNITGVELGTALADVARHELRNYPNVQILTGAIENIELPTNTFDLVLAATSFHWIKPGFRYLIPHKILKHQGYLAIIHTNHVSDKQGDLFFKASQPIYDYYDFTDKNQEPKLPDPESITPLEMDENLFRLTHFQLFPIVITYNAREFTKLLNTFSNHLAASEQVRNDFLFEIENLINQQFNGSITRHFSMSLTVALKIEKSR